MQHRATHIPVVVIGGLVIGAVLVGLLWTAAFPHVGAAPLRSGPSQRAVAQNQPAKSSGQSRVYYVAADEVEWDYAPAGRNLITGHDFDATARVYVDRGPDRIGSVYRKSLYRAYTDETFRTLEAPDPRWQHLGTLGPPIHAEVGDTIEVHFKNNTRFPASIHPHGVFYAKDSEGAPYNDGVPASEKGGVSVPPDGTFIYHWDVPDRAGPGPMDGSSVLWMYHGHVDEIVDTYAGLVGPLIVIRKGMAGPDGSPKDVDREFVTLFQIMDENQSPYLDVNIREHAGLPPTVKKDDADFQEANKKHTINGYLFGNQRGLTMYQDEHVRWYVMDLGTEGDLHTPHWHGETGLANGARTDMLQLLPGAMLVFDMQPDDAGTWLFHCHVGDHIRAGMQELFTVLPAAANH